MNRYQRLRTRVKNRGLKRCGFVFSIVGSLAFLSGCGEGTPGSTAVGKPNVLVIVVDDLGYHDLGFQGNDDLQTPHIDRFFRQSAVFTKNYADATCQPFRNALLTGESPVSGGFIPTSIGIAAEVETVPERMRDAGYRTEHIGKWHQGWLVPEAWPLQQGYDYFFGFLFQRLLQGPEDGFGLETGGDSYFNPWLMENNQEAVRFEGHLTDLLADRVVERLWDLSTTQQPWFMNYWLYAPHSPIQPSESFVEDASAAGRYRALIRQMDFNVGRVLAALEQSGQMERTIVVFVSDNGGTNREINNNAPFSGVKTTYLEGGLRTPLAIRVPGQPHQTIGSPVTALDLADTVLAIGGAQRGESSPGRDVRRLINGQNWPERPNYWEGNHFTGPYQVGVLSANGRWRYGEGPDSEQVLFDLWNDPLAQQNLAPTASGQELISQELLPGFAGWHNAQVLKNKGEVLPGQFDIIPGGLRNTPGLSRVSWGLGVRSNMAAEASFVQADVATLRVAEGQVDARVYGLELTGELPAQQTCMPVVLSTFGLHPGVRSDIYSVRVSLYVGDSLVDQGVVELPSLGNGYQNDIRVAAEGESAANFIVWGESVRPEDSLRRAGVQRLQPHLCP